MRIKITDAEEQQQPTLLCSYYVLYIFGKTISPIFIIVLENSFIITLEKKKTAETQDRQINISSVSQLVVVGL